MGRAENTWFLHTFGTAAFAEDRSISLNLWNAVTYQMVFLLSKK